ncbi:MAG TPA: response regulator [Anaerolineae bacterium]|nr:response regulator [Anaerolineae bacterium]
MSNILVVEDEPNVRKLVTVNLSNRGHTVVEAKNAQEAFEQFHLSPFDLMVLDIKLPDFTGWELLTKIDATATLQFTGPVLVMTASLMDAQVDLKRYPMVVEILIKPFSAAQLMAAVTRALLSYRT